MQRHGLRAAISEYEDRNHNEIRQSLYLRLIRGLGSFAASPVSTDVKGLALRARRIKHKGVVRTQIKRGSEEPAQAIERFSHKRTK